MEKWYILQIILDIYLCGFVIYYIVAYRKKEYDLMKKQQLREETEVKKINDTLKDFLKNSEAATLDMVEAFKREHHAIKQSINYINLRIEELNKASTHSQKLLNTIKEEIPNEEMRDRQNQLKYKDTVKLLAKGFAPAIVAERMKMPIGEVELVGKMYMTSQQETSKSLAI